VYSTCSLNPIENEAVIASVLSILKSPLHGVFYFLRSSCIRILTLANVVSFSSYFFFRELVLKSTSAQVKKFSPLAWGDVAQ